MSTDIVPQQAKDNVVAFLAKHKTAIERCIPKHLTGERILAVMNNAFRKTPQLMNCTPVSVLNSVLHIAQLGLEVRPGSAYLIPYGKECTPVLDYRGKIDLARRSREVKDITAEIVHAADDFEFERGVEHAIGFRLVHRPALLARDEHKLLVPVDQVGAPVLGYGVAILRDGGAHAEVMRLAEIDVICKKSLAKIPEWKKGKTPWETDWEQMARKTVVHRLCKWLPQTPELALSQQIDDAEAGDAEVPMFQNLQTGEVLDIDDDAAYEEPIVKTGTAEQQKLADAIIAEKGGPDAQHRPPTEAQLQDIAKARRPLGKEWVKIMDRYSCSATEHIASELQARQILAEMATAKKAARDAH